VNAQWTARFRDGQRRRRRRAVDEAVRSVSFAVKRPVQKLTGFSAGVSARLGVTCARDAASRPRWRSKAASARRER